MLSQIEAKTRVGLLALSAQEVITGLDVELRGKLFGDASACQTTDFWLPGLDDMTAS